MRTINRITYIHKIDGYRIYCQFNNGESRFIDFKNLFKQWEIKPSDLEYPLKRSLSEFQKVQLRNGTLVWDAIRIQSTDENGNEVFHPYEIDPVTVYDHSEPDTSRNFEIGRIIKKARQELGLTQSQLAEKSGTSKHYISKLENNKSGIELSTLRRIIEGGLGKKLQIEIL